MDISRLPSTDYTLYGRTTALQQLTDAWHDPKCNIVTIVALGGTGKTALINHWLQNFLHTPQNQEATAESVFAWSFYNQGTSTDARTSSELFIHQAFKFFRLADPGPISIWDKGRKLAEALHELRAILVLDGLETLQETPTNSGRAGYLRDEGIRSLLRGIAVGQPGLCIITTRIPVSDLRAIHPHAHRQIDLEQLNDASGAELLRHLLSPPDAPLRQREFVAQTAELELRRASHDFSGHALALRLLGNYIATAYGGNIYRRNVVSKLLGEESEGAHARRVMRSYEEWFSGQPELDILRLLSLFDRPAEPNAIAYLRRPPAIPGLTARLQGLEEAEWNKALSRLHRAGLITSETNDALDSHPLVRAYFGDQLRASNPDGWKRGNDRLLSFFKGTASGECPISWEEMENLGRAIKYACEAGKLDVGFSIYTGRIHQFPATHPVYSLGAYGADLSTLACFFEQPWTLLAPQVQQYDEYILGRVAINLGALGRFREALSLEARQLAAANRSDDFESLAVTLGRLSRTSTILGNLSKAIRDGEESVKAADRGNRLLTRAMRRSCLGDIYSKAGEPERARIVFGEAVAIMKYRCSKRYPEEEFSIRHLGYEYGDFLLSEGDYRLVLEELSVPFNKRSDLASPECWLDFILAARALKIKALEEHSLGENEDLLSEISTLFETGISGLRGSMVVDALATGLLARARFFRLTKDFSSAARDIDEVLELATQCEMKLFEIDCHIEYAWLKFTAKQGDEAAPASTLPEANLCVREHVKKAERLVAQTGYRRNSSTLKKLNQQLNLR